jgi:hypothetical protein
MRHDATKGGRRGEKRKTKEKDEKESGNLSGGQVPIPRVIYNQRGRVERLVREIEEKEIELIEEQCVDRIREV